MGSRREARRRCLVLVALSCVAATLAGCTSDAEPKVRPSASSSVSPSPSSTRAPVTLRFTVYGDSAAVSTYRRIADAFTAEQPSTTVRVIDGTTPSETSTAVLEQIKTGIDAPDVFLLDQADLPAFAAADVLQPVNDLLEDRGISFGDGIQRVGLNAFSANDVLACMPYDVSPLVVFFNRRLLTPRQLTDADGEPVESIADGWRWEVFAAAVQQIATRGAKAVYLPPDLTELGPILKSAGGTIVDDERDPSTLTLSDADTSAALKQIAAITRDTRLALTPTQAERKPADERFADGNLGMLIGTRALVPKLRAVEGLRFDVAPLPRFGSFRTGASMNALCIPKGTAHVEEAADFVAFATDGEGARIAAETGAVVPASLGVLHSPAFTQRDQLPRNARVFADSVRRADPEPFSRSWPAVVAYADDALTQVLYGDVDVTSPDTPELDQLLQETDTASAEIFAAPATPTPAP